MKRIISLLLCFLMIFPLAACSAGGNKDTVESEYLTSDDADTPVMSTANFSITAGELNYIFYKQFNQFLYNYQSQLGNDYQSALKQYLGLDIEKSLRDQMLPDSSDTFYNYFLESAKLEAGDILLFCEYAKENGLSAPEDQVAENEAQIKSYVDAAAKNSVTLAEYMGDPTGITTEEILKSYVEKNTLASVGYDHRQASHEYTEDMVNAEFEATPKKYAMVSYLAYTFEADDKNVSADSIATYAADLAAAKDPDSFAAYAENFHNTVLYAGSTSIPTFYKSSIEYKNVNYAEDSDYLEWMFSGALVGETHIITDEKTGAATVYMLTSQPGENEYDLKNVRHILFLSTSFDSVEDCKKRAEEIYALYQNNPTEENFASLAKEYSEDPGSKDNGGLYSNIDYNEMVPDFENWCFEEGRQVGDTGIVFTSYGYHIMYFSGNGDHVRKGYEAAEQGLANADYEKDYAALKEAHDITTNDTLIEKIEG